MERIILTFSYVLLAVTALLVKRFPRRSALRILYGAPDTEKKYPYVVAILSDYHRLCTGTLLTSDWVLTSANCIAVDIDGYPLTHIQYGDMTILPNDTLSKVAILEQISHPGFRREYLMNDVAMLRVLSVPMTVYGKLSAVHFTSLNGMAVKYTGYGTTEHGDDEDERRPLMIGEGVVTSCYNMQDKVYWPGLYLCVAPKCSNKLAESGAGDTGGPLFYDEKIVGIVNSGLVTVGYYTAISPYLTWINEVMKITEELQLEDIAKKG